MYKIVGGDQKEYGPVTADELRRWIAEGRLNGQSHVRLEGQTDWQPLSSFPEFTDALAAQVAPTYASVAAGVTAPVSVPIDEILARQPVVDVGDCLARSWKLMTANFSLLFCASFLAWLILLVQFIPLVGGFLSFLAYGILFGGLYSVFLNRIRGRPAAITDVFAGFSVSPAQLMLVGFLTALLTKIGTICCFIIPGVYLQVAWAFAIALVADKRLEFWGAMELSRKVVTRVWFKIFGLLLVSFLPYLLCYLAVEIILVGRIFPTIQGMLSSGQPDYQRMTETIREIIKNTFSLVVMLKFVLLLNLPFAVGALMYAYEDLFGPRPASTT